MYYYTLPPEQFEINKRAKEIKELYPEVTVEFGYEHEVAMTAVLYIHNRILYAYTNENFRRQGFMSIHLKSLIKRTEGSLEAVCSTHNLNAQIMLARCGFVPNHFIKPLIGEDRWSDTPYLVYKHATELDIKKTITHENVLSPAHSTLKAWVEESIVIEQIPMPL
jgi:RimJ/RimL family protein N-acetyltransferase